MTLPARPNPNTKKKQVDAAPFRAWYQTHYGVTLGKKKGKAKDAADEDVKKSKSVEKKLKKRCKTRELDGELKEVRTTLSPLYHPFAYDNIPLFYGTWNSSLLTQCYIDLIPYVLLWRSTTYKFNYQADANPLSLLSLFTLHHPHAHTHIPLTFTHTFTDVQERTIARCHLLETWTERTC